MKILIEFGTDGFELHPVNLARLLLDIQHLAIVTRALAEDNLKANDIVFDPYKRKYKWLIEATEEELGMAELTVVHIRMDSPLLVELQLKKLSKSAQKAFTKSYQYIINHLLYNDLEREKRSVEILMMREQVLEKRLKNASSALNLVKKIPDEQLREEFIDSLRSSVLPFGTEHPPIKTIKLIGEKGDDVTNEADEDLIDDIDDDSTLN
jgi:uncharacterized protein YnzC (UPF0291/DUF896 family)